jgi:hypothetical protein
VARQFNNADRNKVAVNWENITVDALSQGCQWQLSNNSDWHADLSAQDLSKYLAKSTEVRWWTPANLSAAVQTPQEDDGMLTFANFSFLRSKRFQSH